MKGDFTKLSFDKENHYCAVLMQQGRVQLDSDWNEQVQIAEHRYSTFFRDLVGQSGAPAADAMRIERKKDQAGKDTNALVVKSGNYYVDGLLVENEKDLDLPLPYDGVYLYYLDVWRRVVAAAENPDLLEPALGGPDTTARLKTEWLVQNQAMGALTVEEIRKRYCGAWPLIPAPKSGDFWQLTLSTAQMKINSARTQITDNRLYRIEIHAGNFDQKGKAIPQSFKWSRDNGAVVAQAKAIDAATSTITLENAGLNVRNAFNGASHIEVYDALCCRNGTPGYLVDVDMSTLGTGKIIIKNWNFDRALTALESPICIRRWDGKSSSYSFELEGGLKVNFPDKAAFYRNGDYWLIQIRSGSVVGWDEKVSQLPHGVEHHFAALAMVSKNKDKVDIVNLSAVFQPLISGSVSKKGDTIDGDLSVLGRLSVGSGFFNAPLSIAAAADGKIASFFRDKLGHEAWRISQQNGTSPSLSITDSNGNGLTILKGGNVGIGTNNPAAKLEIADGMLKLTQNDCCIEIDPWTGSNGGSIGFVEGGKEKANLYWNKYSKLFLINSTGDSDTSLNLNGGNVGIGTETPISKLDVAGKFRCGNAREHAVGLDSISTISITYVLIDAMQLSINTANNPVLVIMKVPSVRTMNDDCWAFFRLTIDGKEVDASHNHLSSSWTQEVVLTWLGNLTEGKHTIKGEWRNENNGTTLVACGWGSNLAPEKRAPRHIIAIEL